MSGKRRARRIVALSLVVLGGVLMYLAPGDIAGLALLAAGIVLELVGIALERRR